MLIVLVLIAFLGYSVQFYKVFLDRIGFFRFLLSNYRCWPGYRYHINGIPFSFLFQGLGSINILINRVVYSLYGNQFQIVVVLIEYVVLVKDTFVTAPYKPF